MVASINPTNPTTAPIAPSNHKSPHVSPSTKSTLASIAKEKDLNETVTGQFRQNTYSYMLAQILHQAINGKQSDETGYIRVAFEASKPAFFLYPSFWLAFSRHLGPSLTKIQRVKAFAVYLCLFLPLKIFLSLSTRTVISSLIYTTKTQGRLLAFFQKGLKAAGDFIEKHGPILNVLALHKKMTEAELTKQLESLFKKHSLKISLAQKYIQFLRQAWMPENRLAKAFKTLLMTLALPIHLPIVLALKAYEVIINLFIASILRANIPPIVSFIKSFDFEKLRNKSHIIAMNRFVNQASFTKKSKTSDIPQELEDTIKVFSGVVFKFYVDLDKTWLSSVKQSLPFVDTVLAKVIEHTLADLSEVLLEEGNAEKILNSLMQSFNLVIAENHCRSTSERDRVGRREQHHMLSVVANLIKDQIHGLFLPSILRRNLGRSVFAAGSVFGAFKNKKMFHLARKVQSACPSAIAQKVLFPSPSHFNGAAIGAVFATSAFKFYDFLMGRACRYIAKKIFNADLT